MLTTSEIADTTIPIRATSTLRIAAISAWVTQKKTERVLPHAHTPQGWKTELYDLETDPHEMQPLEDPEVEARMRKLMVEKMILDDAPVEQYTRMGLEAEYAEAVKG